MNTAISELESVLDQLIELLNSDQDKHWSNWMLESKRQLYQSSIAGANHLLRAYGGMGSFNDLIIFQTSVGGRFAWKDGYREANEKLKKLRARAWELATWIKKGHEKSIQA